MSTSSGPNPADASKQLLATLWEKGLPLLRERLAQLDKAAKSTSLSAEERAEAAGTAHKLAGSLGMYGYPEGTKLARKLEVELEDGAGMPTLRPLAEALRKALGQ